MPDIGLPELLIILLIVLLLFGPGRISKAMGELGKGIGAFKHGMTDEMKTPPAEKAESSAPEKKPTEEK